MKTVMAGRANPKPTKPVIALVMLLITPLVPAVFSAPPAPYPVIINSQQATAPSLDAYKAVAKSFRVTYRDGTNAVNITNCTPFMVRSTNNVPSGSYYTSSWSVVSNAGGIVDFTFAATALNATGVYAYECGIIDTNGTAGMYRAGAIRLLPSAYGSGVATDPPMTTLDFDNYVLVNTPWTSLTVNVTNAIQSMYGTNGITASYTLGGGSTVQVFGAYFDALYATTAQVATAQATGVAAYASATAAQANANTRLASNTWAVADSTTNYVRRTGDTMSGVLDLGGNSITGISNVVFSESGSGQVNYGEGVGAGRIDVDGRSLLGSWTIQGTSIATGTPLYVESDPAWSAASSGVRYAETLIVSQDIDWTSAPFDQLADGDDVGAGGVTNLDDLADVDIAPSANDVLTWDGAAWTNAPSTGGDLSGLSNDVLSAWATASNAAADSLAQGVGATNLAYAIGAGATSLAYAVGAGATSAVNGVGASLTNFTAAASNSFALVAHAHATNAYTPTALTLDAGGTAWVTRTGSSTFSLDTTPTSAVTLAVVTGSWATNEVGIARVDIIGTSTLSFAAASFHGSGFNSRTNVAISALWPTTLILSKPFGQTSVLWRVSQVIP